MSWTILTLSRVSKEQGRNYTENNLMEEKVWHKEMKYIDSGILGAHPKISGFIIGHSSSY